MFIHLLGKWLVENKLGNSSMYTAVHKRYMEGECPEIYGRVSNVSDFSEADIPIEFLKDWKSSSKLHPICSMTYDFVQAVQKMHNRNNQPLYLAWDGYGSIEDFQKNGNFVLSNQLDLNLFPEFRDPEKLKFLDMYMSIHSDLFIMNPRSTYSWQIFVVR